FFAAAGSPWSTRRVGHAALDEIVRKVLLTYWNTVSFLVLYANAAAANGQAWTPAMAAGAPEPAARPLLDRWLLSELNAVTADDPDSVHLASWPVPDQDLIDERLSTQMHLARRLVELGRSARAAASIQIRQPLARALVGAAGFADLAPELRDQIAAELNVRSL